MRSLQNVRPSPSLDARCNQLGLTWSFCDVSGKDPNAIFPRNFGQGNSFFTVNMRFSKNFGFGGSKEAVARNGQGGRGGQGGGGNRVAVVAAAQEAAVVR
jgi:hypothetical protein